MKQWITGALAFGLAVCAAGEALAQDGACPAGHVGCASARIAYRHREGIPLEFDYDTDWVPRGSPVQVRIRAVLAGHTEVTAAGSLVGGWPEPMTLYAVGAPREGTLTVDYGVQLSARIRLQLDTDTGRVNWEGNLPFVPMIDFRAMDRQVFDPWAWRPVSARGMTMRARIADVSITDAIVRIPGISGGFTLSGAAEVGATYQSTRFTFGTFADPITATRDRTVAVFTGGPFVEYEPRLEGALSYSGTIHLYPGLYISLFGRRWMVDLFDVPVPVGPFPRDIRFPPARAHLSLPDIDVGERVVDFGDVPLGATAERTLDVTNRGEAPGRVTSPRGALPFVLPAGDSAVPVASRIGLPITFAPTLPGPVEGTVALLTTDPDTPTITVRLRGNGVYTGPTPARDAGRDVADALDGGVDTGAAGEGCGCAVPGARVTAWSGGWLAVALVSAASRARRRRRRQRSPRAPARTAGRSGG